MRCGKCCRICINFIIINFHTSLVLFSVFRLTVLQNQIRVIASDLAGLHYAVSTLIQLLEIFDTEEVLPCVQVCDHPP